MTARAAPHDGACSARGCPEAGAGSPCDRHDLRGFLHDHYVYGREEWLLVLAGTPTLRHPQGEADLAIGDLVCFPEGPAGARRLLNCGESVVRALFLSTTGLPANGRYPDTGHWLIRNGLGRDEVVRCDAGRLGDENVSEPQTQVVEPPRENPAGTGLPRDGSDGRGPRVRAPYRVRL
jgi:hypothetical protein